MTDFNKPTQEDWDALAEKRVAAIGRAQRETLEDAAVRAAHKVMAEFNDTESLSSVKQEIVRMTQSRETLLNMDRNKIIEEVAQHIEKLQGFGKDTIDSLAIYIREMKK
jgi:CHASE3 domain sensor protein